MLENYELVLVCLSKRFLKINTHEERPQNKLSGMINSCTVLRFVVRCTKDDKRRKRN